MAAAHKKLETWARAARDRRHLHSEQKQFSLPKESHAVQPGSSAAVLAHQSRSFPGGQPRLARSPSVSSQGSVDSGSVARQGHRGSSPQIRTFTPDGRSSEDVYDFDVPTNGSPRSAGVHLLCRSPSPLRAASFDVRCSSPTPVPVVGQPVGELRTPSPSQSSLTSLTERSVSPASSVATTRGPQARCLSPLLIPPRSPSCYDAPPSSPLGAIRPDLYTRREGPLFLGDSDHSLGRLHIRLKYDFDRSDFTVHLIEAHDLAGSDQGGFNDPYVKLALVPEVDNRKRQTSIHRNDPNPFFDETFKFPVSMDDLQSKELVLQVFDFDRFSRNDVIGEVRIRIDELDLSSSLEIWGEITRNKKPPEEMQEVLLSLSYLPSAERLTVVLLKARNLFLPSDKYSIDPYVKVYLLIDGKRMKKKKTAARKENCNPVWNEALSFNVSASNLPNAAIEICVMDQANELMSSGPLLGCCVVGPREHQGPERDHWIEMTQTPRKAVAMWHTIR
ncbi:synaptotagmin-5 isoform X2 [Cloeon dipterum]|uniref:synaptotagmin-5 isoform X2 n=1 Tax=Cloeon dipterum TaxID=197152 RepID=UPI00321FFFF2